MTVSNEGSNWPPAPSCYLVLHTSHPLTPITDQEHKYKKSVGTTKARIQVTTHGRGEGRQKRGSCYVDGWRRISVHSFYDLTSHSCSEKFLAVCIWHKTSDFSWTGWLRDGWHKKDQRNRRVVVYNGKEFCCWEKGLKEKKWHQTLLSLCSSSRLKLGSCLILSPIHRWWVWMFT